MTGVVAKYIREHTMGNEIWDEGQLGAVEVVLGGYGRSTDYWSMHYGISEAIPQYLILNLPK